ncbi:MAG: hypothetical protein AAFV98_00425 [Chloroflexota bacterium]
MRIPTRLIWIALLVLSACNLGTTAPSTTETSDPVPQADGERLVVAWVDAGNLMVWQTGDTIPRRIASGGVVQPFIAPDGEHIIFTRGANGIQETLWVVDTDGTAEQQLVGERPATYTPGRDVVGDVAFLDTQTVIFNTLRQENVFYVPQNDLYRVDIITRELSLISNPGDGGRLTISPDNTLVATAYHGTYSRQDGALRIVDITQPTNIQRDNLLFFVGVATGAEYSFYPTLHWTPDSEAVLVAIPDADLIYSETSADAPATTLWRIPVNDPSGRDIIGTIETSFFGLPRWSADTSTMVYLQRTADSNQVTAFLADTDGSNQVAISGGSIEQITLPQWIADTNQVYYAQPSNTEDGTHQYFIASRDAQTTPLSDEGIYRLQFVSATQYVYVTPGNGRLDMRVGTLNGDTAFIGSLNTVPIFDARLVND